jgi:hypothetical protein
MDEVRDLMRLHRYSIHTERSYCDRIKRFIQFHNMKSLVIFHYHLIRCIFVSAVIPIQKR